MAIDNNNPDTSKTYVWAVAVFAARESASELLLTIKAVIASANKHTVVDIMVNGNVQLALEVSELLKCTQLATPLLKIRVWSIALGDKAHAWNQYVHHVCPSAKLYFFVDGYVHLKSDALRLLDDGLAAHPESLAGTGVPTTGRTAMGLRQQMLAEGGIHGNLFVLKAQTMHMLRQIHFNLPLGIYRTDPTLGAALAFGLDPSKHQWDIKNRVFVHPQATWTTSEKKWWRYAELKSQFKRVLRQGQGALENKAVENFLAVQKHPPELLPRTAAELVLGWVKNNPLKANAVLWRAPLSRLALKKFHEPRDWTNADVSPQLISTV